jgi:hypothetical protein
VAVFKDLNVGAFRHFLSHALRQLHRSVVRVVVPHEAAAKTNQNVGRICCCLTYYRSIRCLKLD